MSVLLVRPRATGGLAAHVDHEREVLEAAGIGVHEADVDIRERPDPRHDLAAMRALRRSVADCAAETVHAHGLRAGALSALALPTAGARLVVTLHNIPVGSPVVRAVGAVLLRILARRADTVLAVSPDLADRARRAGARDVRPAIIPAPGAPGQAPPRPVFAAGQRLEILTVARLAPQKDLDMLLDAVAILQTRRVPVRVRIAGEGPLRAHLTRRIADEAAPVELLGHRTDLPALIAQSDLAVSSARWEGQPVAIQELLRAGIPLVATDAGGTRWVTAEAARLVPVGDAEALADVIQEHTDPSVLDAAAAASIQRGKQLPTAHDMAVQLLDVLSCAPRR